MKCDKCNYDFGNLNPNYCPNCGKKAKKDVINKRYKNIDLFRMCAVDKDRFANFWEKKPSSNIEDIRKWLLASTESASVYCIVANYDRDIINVENKYLGTHHGTIKRASVEEIQNMFLHTKSYSNIELRLLETTVSSACSLNKYRENWWWNKEECESAINEIISKNGKK